MLGLLSPVFVALAVSVLGMTTVVSGFSAQSHKEITADPTEEKFLKMKGAKPEENDAYLCASYTMPAEEKYIVKFEADADPQTAHHILLFGCDGPAVSTEDIWQCPPLCASGAAEQILFAWAKNAPARKLPDDVGFRVGGKSTIKTIVLQIHYAHRFNTDAPKDRSGIIITLTEKSPKYVAGIFLLLSAQLTIPPDTEMTHSDISCSYTLPKTMHPFAYRTHAHSLGTVITGYQVNDSWHEIGKGNPQWPQAFYPANGTFSVLPGDRLVARCSYNSTGRNRPTYIGATGADEMCNFYIMFYTDASVKRPYGMCSGNNFPRLVDDIPSDSDVPLPPNPDLEETAKGHHHHHHSMAPQHHLPPTIPGKTGNDLELPLPMEGQSDSFEEEFYPDYAVSEYLKSLGPLKNQKRFGHDYYDELGENSAQDPSLDSDSVGKNRNRNKAFEAMNKQLAEFSHIKQSNSKTHEDNGGTRAGPSSPSTVLGPVTENAAKPNHGGPSPKPIPVKTIKTQLKFDSKWPKDNVTLGQVGGVATDKDGNVYVFHRASRVWNWRSFDMHNRFTGVKPIPEDTVIIFDKEGKVIRKFGSKQFYMPHGIEVDQKGNIWLTDVALHQVMRIPAGSSKPDLILGEEFEPDSDAKHFCKPADVAVMSTGEFFVADGYCNSRIMKFSSKGKLLMKWGRGDFTDTGAGPSPPLVFDIPHSVTVSEKDGLVCVADRENGRIQCFDLEGNFRHIIEIPEFGPRLFALEYCPMHGGVLFAVNGPPLNGEKVKVQGFTLDIVTGQLLQKWAVKDMGFDSPHDVAVDPQNHAVYVGELKPKRVWRLYMNITEPKDTVSQPDKKGFTPDSETNTQGEITDTSTKDVKKKSDFTPSIIIGVLLVVPVVILLIATIIIRLHHSGKMTCFSERKTPRVFSLQNFLNSHKGFDRLSTEESDHEVDPLDDSDQEEYTAPVKKQRA